MRAIGAYHGMLVRGAILRAAPDRSDIAPAIERVIGRRREIRPVRLDVRQMQHPRRLPLRPDPVERAVGEVRGLGVRLLHARRQMGVAHLPARDDVPAVVRRDHEVAPRVGARVPVRPQIVAVAGLRTGRQMSVVTLDRREAARAQQRAALRLGLDAEARQCGGVGQHVALAGERGDPPPCAQVVAECVLRDGQRDVVPRRAVRIHVAARVERHPRRPADAGLDERVVEAHAAPREPVEIRRVDRPAVARDEIAPQLIAHDEQHVAGGAHRQAVTAEVS